LCGENRKGARDFGGGVVEAFYGLYFRLKLTLALKLTRTRRLTLRLTLTLALALKLNPGGFANVSAFAFKLRPLNC
jgi:hypothetical protein